MASEARGIAAARQAAGTLPWIGVKDSAEEQRLQADPTARLQESANFQLGGPEELTGAHDPHHALQKNGGLADQWYMDDATFSSDVWSLAKTYAVTAAHHGPAPMQGRCHPSNARTRPAQPGPADRVRPPFGKSGSQP